MVPASRHESMARRFLGVSDIALIDASIVRTSLSGYPFIIAASLALATGIPASAARKPSSTSNCQIAWL